MNIKYNKITCLLLISIVFMMVFPSCLKDEKEVFTEPASARLQKVIDNYYNLLESSENGWILDYYPGGKDIKFGGFSYTVKFKDKNATVAFELSNDVSETETSLYKIIGNSGPTLTFDSYNTLLHYFTTPNSTNYQALQGDYEFLLLSTSATQDTIYMEGKRYGTRMKLIKLQEQSTDYLTKVQENAQTLQGDNPVLALEIDGKDIDCVADERIFHLSYSVNDSIKEGYYPWVYTNKGIRFYDNSIEIFGKELQELYFTPDRKSLVSQDKSIKLELKPSPFNMAGQRWEITMNPDKSSQALINEFEKTHKVNAANTISDNLPNGENLSKSMYIGKVNNKSALRFFSYTTATRGYTVMYGMSFRFKGVAGESPQLILSPGEENLTNWTFYTHLQPFVSYIMNASPYKVEVNDTGNPTVVKLISTKDPNIWFILDLS